MKIRCGRCGKKYEQGQSYFVLCEECWDEIGLLGDSDSMKFWRTASAWANGDFTREELEELADSAVGQEIIKQILEYMDVAMKLRLIRQELEKLA